ncbi:MAG: hypothetical protein ACRENB_05250 [Gemmatimonadales bacterium]
MTRDRLRAMLLAGTRRIGSVRPDAWRVVALALLLLLFIVVLLVQPSSVGRGGR